MIKKITNMIEILGLFGLIVYTCVIMNYWFSNPMLSQMGIYLHFQKENIMVICVISFYIFIRGFVLKGEIN